MFRAVPYCVTPVLLLLGPVLGKDNLLKNSLLVFDNKYIHQFYVDDLSNSTKYEHNSQRISGFVDFLTVRSFQNSFTAVFGGCDSSAVGYMIKSESTFISQLPLNSSIGVCYAAPGFNNATFYALLKSQYIVIFDSNDNSTKEVSQTECLHSNLQMDYKRHLLFYRDCPQNSTHFLRVLNITNNVEYGKSLNRKIEKFEIDFNSNEVFAIDANVLLKGKLDDSKTINLEVFYNASFTIADLAVSPTNVYIMFTGGNMSIQIVRRSDSTPVPLNSTLDEPRAIAYLGVTGAAPIICLSNSINICSAIAWIVFWKVLKA